MKIKFVLNNCDWKSIPQKIQEIKDFFLPKLNIEIDVQYTYYSNIPFKTVPTSDGSSGKEMAGTTEAVDPEWYDKNVTVLGLGYDMVLFFVSNTDKIGHVTSAGIRTDRDQGPIELTIFGGNEYDHAYNQGVDQGNNFAFFCCHEIAHGLYMLQGGEDNTHKYFYSATPKEFLKELRLPNNASRVDILKKLLHDALELLGLLRKKQAELQITEAPVIETPKPKPDYLTKMCLAIQKHEGWYKGSRSYRNNNPGNLKYIGQQLAIGKDSQGFCIFKSESDGMLALKNMLTSCAKGYSKVYKPDMSLKQFFAIYAPSYDNNDPDLYAKIVATEMDVTTDFQLKELV